MKPNKLVHSIREGQNLDMAYALSQHITASCGVRFVPTRLGDETKGIPRCPRCHPEKKSRPQVRPAKLDSSKPHYVYRCFDVTGRLIYVGCTVNPQARLRSHRQSAWWGDQIHATRLLVFPNRPKALERERHAIATETPRWNVKGRWPYRARWSAEDFHDFHTAIVRAVESTHGVYGSHTSALLAEVEAELRGRFGITALLQRRSS